MLSRWLDLPRVTGLGVAAVLCVTACNNEADWSTLFAEPASAGNSGFGGSSGGVKGDSPGSITFPTMTGGAQGASDPNTGGTASATSQGSTGGKDLEVDPPSVQAGASGSSGDGSESELPTNGDGGAHSSGDSTFGGGLGSHGGAGDEDPGCGGAEEYCDGLDNDCDGEVDEEHVCPRGCTGHSVDGATGYMFCEKGAFDAAIEVCGESAMHLVWIESTQENANLVSAVEQLGISTEQLWIGGSDREREGDWRWIGPNGEGKLEFWSGDSPDEGGEPVDGRYQNWLEDRPNDKAMEGSEDCASFVLDGSGHDVGAWNDDHCEEEWPFICEK